MAEERLQIPKERFAEALEGKKILCLNIPDDYGYMEPALLDELKAALSGHVAVRDQAGSGKKQPFPGQERHRTLRPWHPSHAHAVSTILAKFGHKECSVLHMVAAGPPLCLLWGHFLPKPRQ